MPGLIRHTASLVVRAEDTTLGTAAGRAAFYIDGAEQRPLRKPDGFYVFLTELPERFTLEVRVPGFEPRTRRLERASLPRAPDALRIACIPDGRNAQPAPCLTLEGSLRGLSGMDAVRLKDPPCLYRSFDAKTRVLTLFNPREAPLDRARYAVVAPSERAYETFTIEQRLSAAEVRISAVLTGAFSEQSAVTPVIEAGVYEGGRYVLRVRDLYAENRYLVRGVVKKQERFWPSDFTARLV